MPDPRELSRRGLFGNLVKAAADKAIPTNLTDLAGGIATALEKNPTLSRRRLLRATAAGTTALAIGSSILRGQKAEAAGPTELRPTAYSSIIGFDAVTSDPTMGVVVLPDNTEQVAMTDITPRALTLIGLKPVTDFFAISAAGVRTNHPTKPDRIVIVGDRAINANEGRIFWTKDSGLNWQTINTTHGTAYDVKISPDKRYAFIFQNNERVAVSRLDLGTGALDHLSTPMRIGWVSSLRVNPLNQEQYISEFADPGQGGYFRAIISPTRINIQQFNPQEGYPQGRLVQFINRNNGRNVIWLENTDGRDPLNRPTGTIYWNENDQDTYRIQPTRFPGIPETTFIYTGGMAADVQGNLGFMGVIPVDRNVWGIPWVEKFSLLSPMDPSGRSRIPLPVSRGAFSTVEVVEKNGERFLIVGIKNSPTASDNGLWAKRITNGINIDGWNKITLLAPRNIPNRKYDEGGGGPGKRKS